MPCLHMIKNNASLRSTCLEKGITIGSSSDVGSDVGKGLGQGRQADDQGRLKCHPRYTWFQIQTFVRRAKLIKVL